nr:MAG TPA: hypothetical protein [Caudoviricetes sp.]
MVNSVNQCCLVNSVNFEIILHNLWLSVNTKISSPVKFVT